jgi:hypothetical protein
MLPIVDLVIPPGVIAWVTPQDCAHLCDVPIDTVRTWASRATAASGGVGAACDVRTRRLVVDLALASERARLSNTPLRRAA